MINQTAFHSSLVPEVGGPGKFFSKVVLCVVIIIALYAVVFGGARIWYFSLDSSSTLYYPPLTKTDNGQVTILMSSAGSLGDITSEMLPDLPSLEKCNKNPLLRLLGLKCKWKVDRVGNDEILIQIRVGDKVLAEVSNIQLATADWVESKYLVGQGIAKFWMPSVKVVEAFRSLGLGKTGIEAANIVARKISGNPTVTLFIDNSSGNGWGESMARYFERIGYEVVWIAERLYYYTIP